MAKTAIETRLDNHDRQFDEIGDTLKEVLISINGLRSDMSERGSQMISMLNSQNTMLVKGQTDHEVMDISRFAGLTSELGEVKTKMALYIGIGIGVAAFSREIVAGITAMLGHS